jgi:hypothetical protein
MPKTMQTETYEADLLADLLDGFISGLKAGEIVHGDWDAKSDMDMGLLDLLKAKLSARAAGR